MISRLLKLQNNNKERIDKATKGTFKVLSVTEAIQSKLSLYLGSSDSDAVLRAAFEVCDNSLDEYNQKENNTLGVIVEKDHQITVYDEGRGIDVKEYENTGIPVIVKAFSDLHAGGKFASGLYDKATRGCFTYDTPIALLNGKSVPIGKLAEQCEKNSEKYFWVYSSPKKGSFKFEPAKATAFPTKIVNRLAVVTLDNGEVVKSTVDHPYKSIEGKYIEAQNLKKGQSLASLKLNYDKDGYLYYYNSKQECTIRVNRAVAAMRGDDIEGNDVHHKNGVKQDNRPSNLKTMERWDHLKNDLLRNVKLKKFNTGKKKLKLSKSNTDSEYIYIQFVGKVARVCTKLIVNNLKINKINFDSHRYHGCPNWDNAKSFIKDAIIKAKINIKENRVMWNGRWLTIEEYVSYKTGLSKKSIVNNQSKKMKLKRVRGKILKIMSILVAKNKRIDESNYEFIRLKNYLSFPRYTKAMDEYFTGFSAKEIHAQAEAYNHKVVSVKIIKVKPTQVYALTVEPNHNYLLGAGVFVKNTHGLGSKATNALSHYFEVWTFRQEKWWNVKFEEGKLAVKLNSSSKPPIKLKRGTIIRFKINLKHFDNGSKLPIIKLKQYLQLQSYMCSGIKIYLKTPKNEYHFYEKDGLKALLLKQLAQFGEEALGKPFIFASDEVNIALSWSKNSGENVNSYASGSLTKDGGTHVTGLNDAIRDALKPYKGKLEFTPAEARDGLVGTMNVDVMQPKFSSQAKERLTNDDTTKIVYNILKPAFDEYFKSNKGLTKVIVQRAADLHKSYTKFTADRKSIAALKNKTSKALVSSKLAKAKTKDWKRIELFLVEGASAGGSAKQARNKEYQAVLALKGKILNAFRATPDKLFNNEEIRNICYSIGFELDSKNPIEKLKVGKIILLADPDIDGKHITNLMLSFFQKVFPETFERGHVYTCDTPLFYCQRPNGEKLFGDSLEDVKEKMNKKGYKIPQEGVQRIKGYGEINPDTMKIVAFNPKTRVLTKMLPASGKESDKFALLVSEDTSVRKNLLGV